MFVSLLIHPSRSVRLFFPPGRLYQVEYAMEAISHAGTSLGILASDGVVLAAEKKVASRLLEPSKSSEKIYLVDEYVCSRQCKSKQAS